MEILAKFCIIGIGTVLSRVLKGFQTQTVFILKRKFV